MQSRNRQSSIRGSVLVETLIGSVVLMLLTLFIIDLSQTTCTLYRINYLTKKCARSAAVSAGKTLEEVSRKLRQALLTAFVREIRSGRLKSIDVIFLDQRGKVVPEIAHIKTGALFTLRVGAMVMMSFVPFRLFEPLAVSSGFQKIYLSEGKIVYETDVTFIAE